MQGNQGMAPPQAPTAVAPGGYALYLRPVPPQLYYAHTPRGLEVVWVVCKSLPLGWCLVLIVGDKVFELLNRYSLVTPVGFEYLFSVV